MTYFKDVDTLLQVANRSFEVINILLKVGQIEQTECNVTMEVSQQSALNRHSPRKYTRSKKLL